MKAIIFYKEKTDYERIVTDYLRDFEKQTGKKLETINPDTAEGAHLCRTYDIVEYPTMLAISDDGAMQNMWRGLPLPTISEVSYYA